MAADFAAGFTAGAFATGAAGVFVAAVVAGVVDAATLDAGELGVEESSVAKMYARGPRYREYEHSSGEVRRRRAEAPWTPRVLRWSLPHRGEYIRPRPVPSRKDRDSRVTYGVPRAIVGPGRMRVLVILGLLSVLVLRVGMAGASADPYRDQAERIPCPPAPAGWTNPPESDGGRYIITPFTAVELTDDPTTLVGAPIVQLDCHYRLARGEDIPVSVRYALPIDINPWNDFYIGCSSVNHEQAVSTTDHAWNTRERVYRLVGDKTWSLATFIDAGQMLRTADVPRFEAVTKAMLKSAQPYAHNCKLAGNGDPVGVKSLWTFNFDVTTKKAGVTSSATTRGSFVTASVSENTFGSIANLFAADFHLNVKSKGKTHSLGIRVGAPIAFSHGYGSNLRTHVLVTASNDPGCRKGSQGTLLVSSQNLTPPHVALRVCGQTYLDGKGAISVVMKTVS